MHDECGVRVGSISLSVTALGAQDSFAMVSAFTGPSSDATAVRASGGAGGVQHAKRGALFSDRNPFDEVPIRGHASSGAPTPPPLHTQTSSSSNIHAIGRSSGGTS